LVEAFGHKKKRSGERRFLVFPHKNPVVFGDETRSKYVETIAFCYEGTRGREK
jgi:hypothetical protein